MKENKVREIWKDIKGYEGLYQVSNCGNVKSVKKTITRNNCKILIKEKILKKYIRQGYYAVKLYKNKTKINLPIHRLVAITYLKNDKNKPCVNHKDGNKLNNNIDNLEWVTYSENTLHSYKNGLQKTSEKQRENCKKVYKYAIKKTSKKINQYDLDGNFIKQWNSINEANRSFNRKKTRINDVCKNRCKQSMGYIWKYA